MFNKITKMAFIPPHRSPIKMGARPARKIAKTRFFYYYILSNFKPILLLIFLYNSELFGHRPRKLIKNNGFEKQTNSINGKGTNLDGHTKFCNNWNGKFWTKMGNKHPMGPRGEEGCLIPLHSFGHLHSFLLIPKPSKTPSLPLCFISIHSKPNLPPPSPPFLFIHPSKFPPSFPQIYFANSNSRLHPKHFALFIGPFYFFILEKGLIKKNNKNKFKNKIKQKIYLNCLYN